MRIVVIGVLLVIAVVAVLAWSQQHAGPFYVSGLIEADDVRVGSRVGGRVRTVEVDDGQTVTTGDLLVELDAYDLRERLAEAEAALAAKQAQLEKLRAGFRVEEIEQARARRDRTQAVLDRLVAGKRPLEISILEDKLAVAQADLTEARTDFDRVKRLHDAGQAAQEEIDDATRVLERAQARFGQATDELALAKEGTRAEEIAEAKATLAEAQQALAQMEAGYRSEDVAQAEAETAAAEARVQQVRQYIEELRVTSPCDCVVEAIDLEPGDLIAANAPVVSLIDTDVLWVRAYVPEDALDLAIDQPVTVRVDAFPDKQFRGHIGFISRQGEFTPSNVQTPEERSKQVFRIKVRLDEGVDVLRAGMAADVFLEPSHGGE